MAGNLDRAIDRLIALQDLLQLKRDLSDHSYGEIGFEAVDASAVDDEIESLKAEIEPAIMRRFETIRRKYDRPLVPMRRGVCYGCFVKFPTGRMAELAEQDATILCESCGRMLYQIP
ncbi:MAG TPA: C4-type zinc ribbon domain-containing protein [Gemmatimonadota bacterium]|nr:C4-type zinc ribbon domain-containing protein [Gemmatimonadota bacterium]